MKANYKPTGPSNYAGMLKQAQKMQEDMQILQSELDEKVYDVAAGGGAVKVTINGKLEIQNIEISKEIVDPDDIETLQDIITAGVNEAIKKVNNTNQEEMGKVTGALNLGGFGGMGGMF